MDDDLGRLKRLGFLTWADCLFCTPKEFRDYREGRLVLPLPDMGVAHYVVLSLTGKACFDSNGQQTSNLRRTTSVLMRAVDSHGEGVDIAVFGGVFPWCQMTPGQEIHLYGDLVTWKGKRQYKNPEFVRPERRGRISSVYKGKAGQVKADTIEDGVSKGLGHIQAAACKLLEQVGMRESEFVRKIKMLPEEFLRMLHEPLSLHEGHVALCLAEELALESILHRISASKCTTPVPQSAMNIDKALVHRLIEGLPYALTADQIQCIWEIVGDLRSPYPMDRLLSGDVGTGKSVTYQVPAVAAHLSGCKVAIQVPNTLLVDQMVNEIQTLFPGVPVHPVRSGGKILDGISVGTTALLGAAKKQKITIDLLVADEQHKFSTAQRQQLRQSHTNYLESTATAIPRTLALAMFGAISLSVLKTCPVQKAIHTRIVPREKGGDLFTFVDKIISAGGQAAIIYPLAEDLADGERASVEAAFSRFSKSYPGRAAMLHGKMKQEDKDATIENMKNGRTAVLVSSTVIEVGVTLPSLRAVIVVHPERFGLSQLHQLRGRVARKGGKGYFFLYLPKPAAEESMARLQLLVECGDGFTLAEKDTELRGFGDIDMTGVNQSGVGRLLFWGVSLTKQQIEAAARARGLIEAN